MSKVGRNEPCPCGSEKKYKKCCIDKKKIRSVPVKTVKETEITRPAYATELEEMINEGIKKAASNQAVEATAGHPRPPELVSD